MEKNKYKILIIDDDDENFVIDFIDLFEDDFYIKRVFSGFQALQSLEEEKFHIALVDMRLNRNQRYYEGLELVSSINKEYPEIIIYGISKDDSEVLISKLIAAGANGFISKHLDEIDTVRQNLIQSVDELQKYKILLIDDDDESFVIDFIDLFEDDFHIKRVFSGFQALQSLEEEKFHIALVDMRLNRNQKHYEGVDLVQQIKNKYPKIVIYGISNDDNDEIRKKLLKAGANGFISKRFDEIETVRKSLMQSQIKNSIETVKTNKETLKELFKNIHYLRELPILTSNDIEKLENILRLKHSLFLQFPQWLDVFLNGELRFKNKDLMNIKSSFKKVDKHKNILFGGSTDILLSLINRKQNISYLFFPFEKAEELENELRRANSYDIVLLSNNVIQHEENNLLEISQSIDQPILLIDGEQREGVADILFSSGIDDSWHKTIIQFVTLYEELQTCKKQDDSIKKLNRIEEIYNFFNKSDKEEQVRIDKYSLVSEKEIEENEKNGIRISSVKCHNIFNFTNIQWDLKDNINIILGQNGFGKTFLLRILAGALQFQESWSSHDFFKHHFSTIKHELIEKGTVEIQLKRGEQNIEIISNVIKDGDKLTLGFKLHTIHENMKIEINDFSFPILAIRDLRDKDTENDTKTSSYDLKEYNSASFILQRSMYGMINELIETIQKELLGDTKDSVIKFIKSLYKKLTRCEIKFNLKKDTLKVQVETQFNREFPLSIHYLSQGSYSVVTIAGVIFEFLKKQEKQSGKVQDRVGIVMIDEIAAHLHATWKQKIVGVLREVFPNVQFIFSTHSPLIVAGALSKEVSVLKPENLLDNKITIKQIPHDFVGWKTSEIYDRVLYIEEKDFQIKKGKRLNRDFDEISGEIQGLHEKNELSKEDEVRLEELYDKMDLIKKYLRVNQIRIQETKVRNKTMEHLMSYPR